MLQENEGTTAAPAATTAADSGNSQAAQQVPAAQASSAVETLKQHLEAASKAELEAIKPLLGKLVRQYVSAWEAAHTSGITGVIERKVISLAIDAAFGPETE